MIDIVYDGLTCEVLDVDGQSSIVFVRIWKFSGFVET